MTDLPTAWDVYLIAFDKSHRMFDSMIAYQGSVNVVVIALLGWVITSENSRAYLVKHRRLRLAIMGAICVLYVYVSGTLLQRAMTISLLYDQMQAMGMEMFKETPAIEVELFAQAIPADVSFLAYLGYISFNLITFAILFVAVRGPRDEVSGDL